MTPSKNALPIGDKPKRLFFALETHAPWPLEFPPGRILNESMRHLTVSFLGWCPNYAQLLEYLQQLKSFPFKVARGGWFDKCLFLPTGHPRVVAWHVHWLESGADLLHYHKELTAWLQKHYFHPRLHDDFLPHVTLCRAPFDPHHWKKDFAPLPMYVKDLHLYESLGNLQYEPRWSYSVLAPFEEMEHTADIAFIIRGETLPQLQENAFLALAFKSPDLLDFAFLLSPPQTLENIIFNLNQIIAYGDAAKGCPFKAVSYHGEVEQDAQQILTWEMIVDV